jgi:site-specific recombinase XerD
MKALAPTAARVPAALSDEARDYVRASKAPATLRAYRADWADFSYWCEARGLQARPAAPETVAGYLTDLARVAKPATLQRRLSAISQAHQAAGHETPTRTAVVRATHAGIRRTKGTAPAGKAPALTQDVRRMVEGLPDTLAGRRDRALVLVGFAGAFRRSELVGLDASDVSEVAEGLAVTIRRSKTDQEGEGRKVGIPYGSHPETCPVRAVRAWLEVSEISSGPLFRPIDRHGNLKEARLSDRAVALVVKRRAQAAGLDPDNFAGHSLRAGLATAAAAAGVPERAIMAQTGHKSLPILRRYIREGSIFRDNAAAYVGL